LAYPRALGQLEASVEYVAPMSSLGCSLRKIPAQT
jgi:hypothetical protein